MTPHQNTDRLASHASDRPRRDRVAKYLVGAGASGAELPPLTDLLGVLVTLAEGTRRKAILPLASSTGEFAFVRRDEHALVSYYDAGPVPQVFVRDRAVDLVTLIEATAAAVREQHATDEGMLALAERAQRVTLKAAPHSAPSLVSRKGGALSAPSDAPLAFGFTIKLPSGDGQAMETGIRADVHALLFDGELWGYAQGRKVVLVRGAVFPAVARMVSAARSVVDAWEARKPVHLKLKAGEFGIALRIGKDGDARVTLVSKSGRTREAITLPALDLASALLPILRVAAELTRTVVATDRAQSKNLRLSALRDEVRALRRIVRTRGTQKSFINRDPDLLRASAMRSERPDSPALNTGKLRLSARWHAEVEGLDASSTFLCGDRIVIATPKHQLALSRDDGQPLWMREASSAATFMAGTALVCVSPDGELSMSDLEDGQVYARTRVAPRVGGPLLGMFAGARGAPPIAVLTEGRDRLVAVDVRTGSQRWRFRSHGRADFRLVRAGRILLVVSGDSTLDAIDVASGEVAWRWSDPGRLSLAPAITRDHAVAIAHQGDGSALLSFDLFSGQLVYRKELDFSATVSPVAAEQLALVAGEQLCAFDLHTGELKWQAADPGLADGAAALVVDQHLVLNAPNGLAQALDVATGELRWQHKLADPTRDDVPRRLEPVLRGGALFLPSANVHVVRPADGALIGGPIAERIIPDFMRIDERGWLYVAEESGLIEAHSPVPSLRLVK
ncbi:MAG TPA: PQQ-binding-like beta-propeller repeat protein [Polyangiales bacterium]|nr:PQQ-binding-like beta-propeller repeat protein [Polyangiales bacterium]